MIFKNPFIATLSSTGPRFAIQVWCRLLPQAEMILNMLQSFILNTTVSEYTQLQDAFNYIKTQQFLNTLNYKMY